MKELFINLLYVLGVNVIFVIVVMIVVSILEHLGITKLPNNKNE